MDNLGFNKIAAAVLATALGVMFLREAPHMLIHSETPETPVYQVGSVAVDTGAEAAEPLPFPQPEWIAAMDATRGAKVFKKCTSCHNAENGGANATGPNLWGVVGAPAGAKGDFKYSAAMAGSGLTWDYETLNDYLAKPAKYLSGTNMNFIGLKKEEDRAAVIELLRLAADAPLDRPAPAVVEEVVETETAILEDAPSIPVETEDAPETEDDQ